MPKSTLGAAVGAAGDAAAVCVGHCEPELCQYVQLCGMRRRQSQRHAGSDETAIALSAGLLGGCIQLTDLAVALLG